MFKSTHIDLASSNVLARLGNDGSSERTMIYGHKPLVLELTEGGFSVTCLMCLPMGGCLSLENRCEAMMDCEW